MKDNAWVWGQPQRDALTKVKEAIAASPILAKFDPNLETVVSEDASSRLGAVLRRSRNLVSSRSITPRYAQIEKEALAFTWAFERLTDYLVGLQFNIQTNHKPLVLLFSTKHLEELQWFRMRMMCFLFPCSRERPEDCRYSL